MIYTVILKEVEKKVQVEIRMIDKNSYANVSEIKVVHASLNLDVDFDAKILAGKVTLNCQVQREGVSVLILVSYIFCSLLPIRTSAYYNILNC
jgi:acyl-coenzyme A thioesterase PaaI-like protein